MPSMDGRPAQKREKAAAPRQMTLSRSPQLDLLPSQQRAGILIEDLLFFLFAQAQ